MNRLRCAVGLASALSSALSCALLACFMMPLAGTAAAASTAGRLPSAKDEARIRIGEAIYLRGVLGSGAPLQAMRAGGVPGAKGADAACVNCHLHSGLGSTHENSGIGGSLGSSQVPPIAGKYLLQNHATGHEEDNLPYVDGMRGNRSPYTTATLARAIRDGVDSDGNTLRNLMPRFAIGDEDLAALIAYLKTLDPTRVPGVTPNVLHFATIITPEVEPQRREAMLDVMRKFFAERNSRQMVQSPQMRASGGTQYGRSMFMVHRQWELHVWDLTGPAQTWEQQLQRDFARDPVFAIVSGLGRHWAPIHEFCEKKRLACLFPNVDVPVDNVDDFYELYLSRGVLLEAQLFESALSGSAAHAPPHLVHQIYRAGDSGEAAADLLERALKARGIDVRKTVLPAVGGDLSGALRQARGANVLVLWLRPEDLSGLGDAREAPPAVYISGLMGGLENSPLPASWRDRSHMAYPFDLPQNRIVRVDYPLGWFRIRGIKLVDEQMQADTYLACGLVSEALSHMVDTFYGPYLIEQLQSMAEHRIVTGYYPRLTLAENQHFASKGGYLVRFDGPAGTKIDAEGGWIVP